MRRGKRIALSLRVDRRMWEDKYGDIREFESLGTDFGHWDA